MSENNKTYRLRTKVGVGVNAKETDKYLTVNLNDSFDTIEVLSLKIRQENAYRVHSSQYGVIVGRAIANGGFGVPNVKVSVFIPADSDTLNDPVKNYIYSYAAYNSKNADGIRYNLLTDEKDGDDCFQPVGTFPNKRLVLDDDNYLEIFDKYYKYTTRTNAAGDYMIFGVPVGSQTIHTDMDLSDIGVLSQKPRDLIYKGYNKNQFETPNKFKGGTNLSTLPQIISQDGAVYVYPFWGDTSENVIGITRYDIDIDYKFEPTCVFMGSIVSDSGSNKISKKCIPSENMGVMEELVTGEGTIEMIRKTITGSVEEFAIQGNQVIDSHGVWCYQIPMNLDYVMTDEYGNLVPSDDPTKGIATRARVRFRVSMNDLQDDSANSFRAKVLVPNNPEVFDDAATPDYTFGTLTDESSYRDLLWNNIYTVKSFIPRFQKNNSNLNRRFSGIKQCNYYGNNNPIPYNNIRIRLSFQFRIACLIVMILLRLLSFYNKIVSYISKTLVKFGEWKPLENIVPKPPKRPEWLAKFLRKLKYWQPFGELANIGKSMSCLYMEGSLCDTLEGDWYFAPGCSDSNKTREKYPWVNMMNKIESRKGNGVDYASEKKGNGDGTTDQYSVDTVNADARQNRKTTYPMPRTSYDYVISRGLDYFKQCVEMSLAEEYRVIQFDFYNDWINGMIYIPRWERHIKRKRKFFLFGPMSTKIRACTETYNTKKIKLTEQCSVEVNLKTNALVSKVGCGSKQNKYKCHKSDGRKQVGIFGSGGAVHEELTASKKYAYYFKPCEMLGKKKVNLFATDLILLGSMNQYNISETPMFIDALDVTSYKLPSPIVFMDTEEEGGNYQLNLVEGQYRQESGYRGLYLIGTSGLEPVLSGGTLAEESGIDWGVSGLGQGNSNIAKNYTPGGHFLGISCMNSETTTKSCINVKRICEAGVSPSSSYETVNFTGSNSGNAKGNYTQVVPNGLIAKDEIIEGDFRKVFATMNHKKLVSKVFPDSLQRYEFYGLYPEGFGGEFTNYAKDDYNVSLYHTTGTPSTSAITEAGKASNIDSFVKSEVTGSTNGYVSDIVRRSLEERDEDYIKFRYGVDSATTRDLPNKFLHTSGAGYAMPVYENSFYFYFGLHNGSTAIDLLRENFFAECEKPVAMEKLKVSLLNGENIDMLLEPQTIGIFETGLPVTGSFPYFTISSEDYPITIRYRSAEKTTENDYGDNEQNGETKVLYSDTGFAEENNIPIGTNTYTITDGNGRSIVKTLQVVRDSLTICSDITATDFSNSDWILKKNILLNGLAAGRTEAGGLFSVSCNYLYKYSREVGSAPISVSLASAFIFLVNGTNILYTRNFNTDTRAFKKMTDMFPRSEYSYGNDESNAITCGQNFIPVNEVGLYDIYVVVKDGDKYSIPILILNDGYISEPGNIDFTIFREKVSTPEDAVNSYRLSYIEMTGGPGWYRRIDDLTTLTDEQRWYLKKDVFYDGDGETKLYITTFNTEDMPVPEVSIKVVGTVENRSEFTKSEGAAAQSMSQTGEMQIMLKDNGAPILTCPYPDRPKTYNSGNYFPFACISKPFTLENCYFWEGYEREIKQEIGIGDKYGRSILKGLSNGDIKNGITYDNKFGFISLNDGEYLFPESDLAVQSKDSVTNRIKHFDYTFEEGIFSHDEVSIEVGEGHPENYNVLYEPHTVYDSCKTIGPDDDWESNIVIYFATSASTISESLVTGCGFYLTLNNKDPLEKVTSTKYRNTSKYTDDEGTYLDFFAVGTLLGAGTSGRKAFIEKRDLSSVSDYYRSFTWDNKSFLSCFAKQITDSARDSILRGSRIEIFGEVKSSSQQVLTRGIVKNGLNFSVDDVNIYTAFRNAKNGLKDILNGFCPAFSDTQIMPLILYVGGAHDSSSRSVVNGFQTFFPFKLSDNDNSAAQGLANYLNENLITFNMYFNDGGNTGSGNSSSSATKNKYFDVLKFMQEEASASELGAFSGWPITSFVVDDTGKTVTASTVKTKYMENNTTPAVECSYEDFLIFCKGLPRTPNPPYFPGRSCLQYSKTDIHGKNFYLEIVISKPKDISGDDEDSDMNIVIKEYYEIYLS